MSKLFDLDNPVIRFLSKTFDILLLGVLWFVGCLPVITIGASTTAMYVILMKLVRDDAYEVFQLYLKSFKENFKQATLIWMIFLGVILILTVDLLILWGMGKHWVWTAIFALLSVLLLVAIVMSIYVVPLQAFFSNTIKNTIKNALLFAIGHLPQTILMLVIDVCILIFFVVCALPLLLYAGVLIGLFNAWILSKIFAKYSDISLPKDN